MVKVEKYRCLGRIEESARDVKKRVQCGYNDWRKVMGVICDRKAYVTAKGKVEMMCN